MAKHLPVGVVVTLLSTVPLIFQVLRNSPAVLTPTLKAAFSLSATEMGLVASATSFGAVLSTLLASRWVDKFGARPVILTMLALVVAGAIGFGLAPNVELLFVSRFLIGFGAGAYFASAMVWIGADSTDTQFKVYLGELSSISRLGAAIATAPLALLVALLTWRYAILALGLLALIIGILLWFYLENTKKSPQPRTGSNGGWWKTTFNRYLGIRLCAIMVLLGSFTSVAGLWGGAWLISAYHLSQAQVSWLLLAMTLGFVLGSSGCVLIERYFHRFTVPLLLAVAASVFFLIANNALSVKIVGVSLFILGFCLAPTTLILSEIKLLSDANSLAKNIFAGSLCFSLGIFSYQALSGLIIDIFPLTAHGNHPLEAYQALFFGVAFVLMLTAVLYLRFDFKSN